MINILIFLSPLLAIVFFSLAGLMISGLSFNELHRGHEIAGKFIEPIRQYQNMAESLKSLAWSSPNPFMEYFLPEVRNLIWLIALGTLLNRFLEAFFYPFVVFYMIGLGRNSSQNPIGFKAVISGVLTVIRPCTALCAHPSDLDAVLPVFWNRDDPQRHSLRLGTGKASGDTPQTAACSAGDCFLGDLSADYRCQPSQKPEIVRTRTNRYLSRSVKPFFRMPRHHTGMPGSQHPATRRYGSLFTPIFIFTEPHPVRSILTNCLESFPDDPDQFKDHLRQNRQNFVLWEEKHWPFHSFTLVGPGY